MARFGTRDVFRLMRDAGVVRNRAKIEATINNARRRRGWAFVGPTTVYSFKQAMGLVNDHVPGCAAGVDVVRQRGEFSRPR